MCLQNLSKIALFCGRCARTVGPLVRITSRGNAGLIHVLLGVFQFCAALAARAPSTAADRRRGGHDGRRRSRSSSCCCRLRHRRARIVSHGNDHGGHHGLADLHNMSMGRRVPSGRSPNKQEP